MISLLILLLSFRPSLTASARFGSKQHVLQLQHLPPVAIHHAKEIPAPGWDSQYKNLDDAASRHEESSTHFP